MTREPSTRAAGAGDPWGDLETDGSIWLRENEHFFRPFSPLWETAWGPILRETVERATRDIGLPIGNLEFRLFHGYAYFRAVRAEGDREERRAKRVEATTRWGDDLLSHWRAELLPRVQGHIDHMRAFDLRGAADDELWAHLIDALDRQRDAWHIHFFVFWIMMLLSLEFDRISAEADVADELLRAELVQDADNAALAGDRALAAIADAARASPDIVRALTELPAADALAALAALPEAEGVEAALRRFLDDYGDRLAGGDDWAEPTWRELPHQAIERVAALLASPNVASFDHAALLRRRDELTERTLASIGDTGLRERFSSSLERMRRAWPLKEEHNFYIDQTLAAHMRYLMLEFGRRFVERGRLDEPDDVFFVTFDELAAAFPRSVVDLRRLVAMRRAERAWRLSLTPPPTLGGGTGPAEPRDAISATLTGRAASPGRARGPARIVLSIDDFGKLRQGDILVCRSTTPHWTPLFLAASAVVAEAGGALSHAAIAAREYGIPAVLSVPDATAIIRDDEPLVVDGSAGIVRRGGE